MLEKYSFFLSYIFQIIKRFLQFTTLFTFWDGILFALAISFIVYLVTRHKKYRVSSVSVNLPFSLGNITYEPTEEDRIVAWKLYTQLKTRKAALIFDEDRDVIADVYDSLYELFPISRDLLMNLPLDEIEQELSIADLVLRIQNDGLRPHLTKWQSGFRRWWDNAIRDPGNKDSRPQDIQKNYPKYRELINELKKMNLELNKYAEDLLNIARTPAQTRRQGKAKVKKPTPIQPSEEPSDVEERQDIIEKNRNYRQNEHTTSSNTG